MAGIPVRQIVIWHRSGRINFNPGYFLTNWEVIYLIAKPDFVLAPGAHGQGRVWRISQQVNTTQPATFPPELVNNCLVAIGTGPVLDSFVGNGTASVLAEQRGTN